MEAVNENRMGCIPPGLNDECLLSRVQLFATPRTLGPQIPLFMGFFRQKYWSGLPCPSPGDLPYPEIRPASPVSPALQADSVLLSHWGSPKGLLGKPQS